MYPRPEKITSHVHVSIIKLTLLVKIKNKIKKIIIIISSNSHLVRKFSSFDGQIAHKTDNPSI